MSWPRSPPTSSGTASGPARISPWPSPPAALRGGCTRAWRACRRATQSNMRIFAVDELCPPAPVDGYFWRQIRAEFLAWAGVDAARCRSFAGAAADLEAMCAAYESAIAEAGGLDVVMLGLGPNAHLASNEPGCAFDLRTRPVRLLDETVRYILTDEIIQGPVCERAVTLGLGTIMAAREIVLLVSGEAKREPLARVLDGPVTPDVPASVLRTHPRCLVIADRAARP